MKKHTDLFSFHTQLNDYTGLGLGLVVFGLGLITVFWSRSQSWSCTLWSRS